jgi:hypothetical protein
MRLRKDRGRIHSRLEFLESHKWLPLQLSPPAVIFLGNNQGPDPKDTRWCPEPTFQAPIFCFGYQNQHQEIRDKGRRVSQSGSVWRGILHCYMLVVNKQQCFWAAVTKHHKLGDLKPIYCLAIWEAKNLRSRDQQGRDLS